MDSDPSPLLLSKREKVFFRVAKDIAELSDHHYRLGCVIVDHHHIVSSGHNSKTKCHPMQASIDKKYFNDSEILQKGPLHAEVDALLPLIKKNIDLTGATLYVYREDKHHHIAMSRPCPRCMSLIKKCGIRKIKYSTPDGFATEKIIY